MIIYREFLVRTPPLNSTRAFLSLIGLWAHQFQSNCLHAAFYVVRVDFADGTIWDWNQQEPHETVRGRISTAWKDSIRPGSTKGCDDSLATQEVLGRLDGTTWGAPGGPTNASTDVVPFFAFSCAIRDDLAWCQL